MKINSLARTVLLLSIARLQGQLSTAAHRALLVRRDTGFPLSFFSLKALLTRGGRPEAKCGRQETGGEPEAGGSREDGGKQVEETKEGEKNGRIDEAEGEERARRGKREAGGGREKDREKSRSGNSEG